MSHQPERKEKDCLNCGTTVAGRFCQHCGQENAVPHQTAWGMIRHFVFDIFHFDGKFFDTVRRLLFRPGLVAKDYVRGRRVRYLDPVRMYLFTSALFFLVFFSSTDLREGLEVKGPRALSPQERYHAAAHLYRQRSSADSTASTGRQLSLLMDTAVVLSVYPKDTLLHSDSVFYLDWNGERRQVRASVHNRDRPLTVQTGSGWLNRRVNSRWTAYKEKYGDDGTAIAADLIENFLHKLPYLLFVSLPFFALLLKLLYVRRKEFLYSDHAVFTLYHYIFSFLLLLALFLLQPLKSWIGDTVPGILGVLLFLLGGVYLFLAMKRFYGQGIGKTFGKFFLLNAGGLFLLLLLFLVFLIFSIIQ